MRKSIRIHFYSQTAGDAGGNDDAACKVAALHGAMLLYCQPAQARENRACDVEQTIFLSLATAAACWDAVGVQYLKEEGRFVFQPFLGVRLPPPASYTSSSTSSP